MTWSAITYKAYNAFDECTFALNETYRKRIRYNSVGEWGIDAPSQDITFAGDDTGDLTGDYNAKFTLGRREKGVLVFESNPSPEGLDSNGDSDPETLAGESLIYEIPSTYLPTIDAEINCIRFYRTKAGGSTYYFDLEISLGSNCDYACTYDWEETGAYISGTANRPFHYNEETEIYFIFNWEIYYNTLDVKETIEWKRLVTADNQFPYVWLGGTGTSAHLYAESINADGALGSEVTTTHYRPPSGTFTFGPLFNGICFIIVKGKLYYSLSKQPEYWPPTYYLDVSSPDNPGLCGLIYDKHPYFITKNKIHYISGTSHSDFYPIETNAKTGTQSVRGGLAVEGKGIFHVGSDGIYLYQGSTDYKYGKDEKFTQAFNRTFRGDTVNGIPGVDSLTNSWLCFWQDKLYFGYVASGNTYPADILVFDFGTGRTSYMNVVDSGGADIEFICGTVDEENNRLLLCDSSGYVWHMESSAVSEDNEVAINWACESKDFTLQTRRHFPRWAKWDVDASDDDCTATGTVYLDGSSQQTHSLTEDRNTKRRLIATGNGKRMSLKVHGSGPVEIYAVEAE